MARLLSALVCGLLFGIGLVVSDMVNPARVLAFLDVAGDWDPSLAFVMGGALVPASIAYAISKRRRAPVFDERFQVPESKTIDRRLVGGAVLFGFGWGLVGLCPGPAIAGLAFMRWEFDLFVAAMVAGMYAYSFMDGRETRPSDISAS